MNSCVILDRGEDGWYVVSLTTQALNQAKRDYFDPSERPTAAAIRRQALTSGLGVVQFGPGTRAQAVRYRRMELEAENA